MAVRSLLTWGTFPVVFGGAVTAGVLALQAGGSEPLVLAVLHVGVVAIIAVLERVHPYEPAWNTAQGDVGTDVVHLGISMLALPELLKAATFGGLFLAGSAASSALGIGLWPHDWPVAAQLVLALLIGEFGAYWVHRLTHEVPLLWRLHATHHSAPRLYWLNAGRFHPLDTALGYLLQMAPIVFLGAPDEVLALFLVVTGVHGLFQHCNIDIRIGPLNYVFSMAELHRWHHSRTLEEGNSNYGANLIVWDIVFGTRFLPADRLPPTEIGIAGVDDFPTDYIGQILSPVRWKW